jgi:uncharacterized protein YbjQ (UPF0145 family)
MRLFGLGNGPYMSFSRGLPNPQPDLLAGVHYQIVPSLRGLPSAQISLRFRRDITGAVSNPDMSLAVLLDRSGSMQEAFAGGHVYNVLAAIQNYAALAGAGFDLVFYDDRVSDAGHMRTIADVGRAVAANPPRGGTYVTSAMRHVIKTYRKRAGMYLIVITDGEFADKNDVLKLVTQELAPQVKPENPYAFRIHFVGAGEGVDHEFLKQIEAAASGQGVQLVTQHHHAHLSHSHASILDEMDRAFIGVGIHTRAGDYALVGGVSPTDESPVAGVVDTVTRRTWTGGVGDIGFLPRTSACGFEYSPAHASTLPIVYRFDDGAGRSHEIAISVPMPRQQAPAASGQGVGGILSRIHLPWSHHTPEEDAARAEAKQRKEDVAALAIKVHQAELVRQANDMRSLAQGGIPQQAIERLKEIGQGDADDVIFTSNLSPEELALLRREGYRVRGIVGGSAVYHVGQAYASTQGDCEVTVLSDAYNEACRLAVGRMHEELRRIRGHGVVGVRFVLVRHEWADKTVEVQVMGTAVDGPGAPPKEPWMCDLSGQEWWALHRAGYEPVRLVWGHCTWFLLTTQQDEWNERSFQNVEINHWSAGLSSARHRAMAHVNTQASNAHATGVCGVRIERKLDEVHLSGPGEDPAYEREHHNLVLSIIGSAIRVRPNAPTGVVPTLNILSLRDGRIAPVAIGTKDAEIE